MNPTAWTHSHTRAPESACVGNATHSRRFPISPKTFDRWSMAKVRWRVLCGRSIPDCETSRFRGLASEHRRRGNTSCISGSHGNRIGNWIGCRGPGRDSGAGADRAGDRGAQGELAVLLVSPAIFHSLLDPSHYSARPPIARSLERTGTFSRMIQGFRGGLR